MTNMQAVDRLDIIVGQLEAQDGDAIASPELVELINKLEVLLGLQ